MHPAQHSRLGKRQRPKEGVFLQIPSEQDIYENGSSKHHEFTASQDELTGDKKVVSSPLNICNAQNPSKRQKLGKQFESG